MQSIYWVLTWACHRKCKHCYDDRFRPYVRDALSAVVGEGQAAYKAIIANLPDQMDWFNPETGQRERSLLVLAGGELLIDGVREELFYPVLRALRQKYGNTGPKISIQTAGDVLTDDILRECLELGVNSIAVASIDDYHVGMQGDKKFAFMEKVRKQMATHGIKEVSLGIAKDERLAVSEPSSAGDDTPTFLFFGAQPDLWIGEMWPRGRAFANGLSDASWDVNFCARWSGGLNFLNIGEAGSEVSIEPNGNVYPCCLKTRYPLGNLTEDSLSEIFDSLRDMPALQAINAGLPEQMGLADGWSEADFRSASSKVDGKGRTVENRCLGCDSYFEAHLRDPLRKAAEQRQARRLSREASSVQA